MNGPDPLAWLEHLFLGREWESPKAQFWGVTKGLSRSLVLFLSNGIILAATKHGV